MVEVSQYLCKKPFEYIQVFENHLEGCCWDWAKVRSTESTQSLQEAWNELEWYRQGSLESPLRVCSLNCPFLKKLQETGDLQGMFIPKVKDIDFSSVQGPVDIRVACDESCNLYCRSCREEKIIRKDYQNVKNRLAEIQSTWGQDLKRIQLLGSGDPLFSKAVREFLLEFDCAKFPKLEGISLHTNGQLLTKELWNSMKAAPYIDGMEISIDAATKETYETVRRGGKWETLLQNIEFITEVSTVKWMCFSFVVQRDNYREIELFYNKFKPLLERTGRCWEVGYNKIAHWGRVSESTFNNLNVFTDEKAVREIKDQLSRLDRSHVRTNII